ncbi:MAG TPA: membrane integrity-associated transporter subunit PqiC [Chromatiaceae bacterium]|nr:membrane integrity-associated transporter subunit PqiC [Chromatiaceae bacterium]
MKTLLIVLMMLLGGCAMQSPSSQFYVLSARAPVSHPVASGLLLGVGPVNLADYLDRSQIVRRDSNVRLRMDEFNRWAGDHGKNITVVLAENLANILGVEGVIPYPWSSSLDLDYQVLLDISRFDAKAGNLVVLDAQWQLFRKRPREQLLQVKRSHIETRAADSSHDAQVEAQSQALAKLATIIAAAVASSAGND